MIDKRKFWSVNRITLLLLFLFFLLFFVSFTFSRYESNVEGKVVSNIAFYLLEAGTYTEDLEMFEIVPDGNNYIFEVEVSNYKDDVRSDVDLSYQLSLVTTTNLPINYEIYLNDGAQNTITSKEVFQDEDMMYFFRFLTSERNFSKDSDLTDHYQIVINFPKEYNEEAYQDLIDSVQIVIDSKQV